MMERTTTPDAPRPGVILVLALAGVVIALFDAAVPPMVPALAPAVATNTIEGCFPILSPGPRDMMERD